MIVRAACHVHSDWSYDGSWRIPDLADLFRNRGYQIVLMTEHDRGFDEEMRLAHRAECRDASSNDILIVSGIEYSDPTNTNHILVWGDVPFAGENVATLPMLKHVKSYQAVAVFAHPTRKKAWKNYSQEWSPYLDGVEIWNRKTDGFSPSQQGLALSDEYGLTPYVGIDFHRRRQLCPLVMRVEVGKTICEESILAAMRNKDVLADAFCHQGDKIRNGVSMKTFDFLEGARRSGAAAMRWFNT